jgi:hypothetical protein
MTIEVQTPRFSQLLQRLFLARGGAGSAGQTVLDDILPVVQMVEGSDPELRRLRGEDMFATWATIISGALNTARVQVENPVGSNMLVILQSVGVSSPAAQAITAGISQLGPQAGPFFGIPTDMRSSGLTQSVPLFTTSQAAPVVTNSMLVGYANPNVLTEILAPLAVVIPPGKQFLVSSLNLASNLTCQFKGYVRQVEPNELS